MVVLQSHVPCFQGLPGSPQWVGLTSGGGGHDCRFHLREYNRGELSGRLGKRDQRMERFQEISHQGGHVPICPHHVRFWKVKAAAVCHSCHNIVITLAPRKLLLDLLDQTQTGFYSDLLIVH